MHAPPTIRLHHDQRSRIARRPRCDSTAAPSSCLVVIQRLLHFRISLYFTLNAVKMNGPSSHGDVTTTLSPPPVLSPSLPRFRATSGCTTRRAPTRWLSRFKLLPVPRREALRPRDWGRHFELLPTVLRKTDLRPREQGRSKLLPETLPSCDLGRCS